MDNLWQKVENIVPKGEIARFAAEASESVYMRERVNAYANGEDSDKHMIKSQQSYPFLHPCIRDIDLICYEKQAVNPGLNP